MLAHVHDTTAWLVAAHPPCTDLRDREVEVLKPKKRPQRTGRVVRPLEMAELAGFEPEGSWVLAILLCPGDNATAAAAWAARRTIDERDRIQFYFHPAIDLAAALAPWAESGLPAPAAVPASTFAQLNRQLGQLINRWIWLDHGPPAH